jgi:hypothetical protein
MAYRSVRVSDLSGKEDSDEKFRHPQLDEPVQFDALPEEVSGLKDAGNLVALEIRNGDTQQIVVTLDEFNKLSPKINDVLKNADGLRGRRKGFRPSQQD